MTQTVCLATSQQKKKEQEKDKNIIFTNKQVSYSLNDGLSSGQTFNLCVMLNYSVLTANQAQNPIQRLSDFVHV